MTLTLVLTENPGVQLAVTLEEKLQFFVAVVSRAHGGRCECSWWGGGMFCRTITVRARYEVTESCSSARGASGASPRRFVMLPFVSQLVRFQTADGINQTCCRKRRSVSVERTVDECWSSRFSLIKAGVSVWRMIQPVCLVFGMKAVKLRGAYWVWHVIWLVCSSLCLW